MSDSDSCDNETPVRPLSEQVPRPTVIKRHRIKDYSDGGMTVVITKNTLSILLIFFIASAGLYVYISQVNPGRYDPQLSRDDCVQLYRKYNCSDTQISGKICQDLNACIFSSDRQCLLTTRDSEGEGNKLEGVEKNLENLALALGGTALGAYCAKIFRLRHHLKTLLLAIFTLITGLITKFTSRKTIK